MIIVTNCFHVKGDIVTLLVFFGLLNILTVACSTGRSFQPSLPMMDIFAFIFQFYSMEFGMINNS